MAAFVGTAGPDILLKCSGFVNLGVYYEGYLAAQNGEQGEESIEEQFKDLIQAQTADLDEDEDEDEDEVTAVTVGQVGDEIAVPTSEILDLEFGVNVNVAHSNESRVPASDEIDVDDLSL